MPPSEEILQRVAVRAVIIRGDALLVLEKRYPEGDGAVALPGGTQDPGETLVDAARRECEEEIGTPAEADALAYVCEYRKRSRDPAKPLRHKVEIGLRCEVPPDYEPRMGPSPDPHQVGVRWLPLAELEATRLDPPGIVPLLVEHLETDRPVLGAMLPGEQGPGP